MHLSLHPSVCDIIIVFSIQNFILPRWTQIICIPFYCMFIEFLFKIYSCQGEHKARDKDGAQCEQNLPQAKRPHLGEEHIAGTGVWQNFFLKLIPSTFSQSHPSQFCLIFQGGQDENNQRASLLPSQHSRGEALWHHRWAEQHMVRER